MRKITLSLLLGLLLVGCSLNQQTNKQTGQENRKIAVSPSIQKNTTDDISNSLKKVREDDRYAYYDGEIKVSGKYSECALGLLCKTLCFYPDAVTAPFIPRDSNDRRLAQFCFNEQDKAKLLFGVTDDEIFQDPRFKDPNFDCKIEGEATVKISNYALLKMQTEGYDTADLKEVISKTGYMRKC